MNSCKYPILTFLFCSKVCLDAMSCPPLWNLFWQAVQLTTRHAGLRDCGNAALVWRCKLACEVLQCAPVPVAERQLAWIIEQLTANLAAAARPPSCLQAMRQLAAAVVETVGTRALFHAMALFHALQSFATVGRDLKLQLLAELEKGHASQDLGSQEERLAAVMQPLIKSSCSARGKRPHCDGPGALLASAIDAVPPLLQELHQPLHATARQIGSLMLQGGMPTDNSGSFKALQAVWSKMQSFALHDPRLTNTTIVVVMRALCANRHWSVCTAATTCEPHVLHLSCLLQPVTLNQFPRGQQ